MASTQISPAIMRLVLYVITLIALLLSCHALVSCSFLVTHEELSGTASYGLFRAPVSGSICAPLSFYSKVSGADLPDVVKVAQAFGILAALLGGAAATLFTWTFVATCASTCTKTFFRCLTPSLLIAASVAQLLTFTAFGIDECKNLKIGDQTYVGMCTFAEGANASFAAFVLYLVPVVPMMCFLPVPREPFFIFAKEAGPDIVAGETEEADDASPSAMEEASLIKNKSEKK